MLRTETRTINGHEYHCTVFPGRKGFQLQARLARIVAPVLAGIQLGEAGSIMDASIQFDGGKLAQAIIAALNPKDLDDLCLALFESTHRDERPLNSTGFDEAFAGNYGEILQAIAFVIETNGFFGMTGEAGGLSGAIKMLSQLVSSATASKPSGPAGGSLSSE